MNPIRVLAGAGPLERRRYYFVQVICWIYTVVWLLAIVWVGMSWRQHPGWLMGGLVVLLGILTPTLGDLFMSYASYRRHVEQHSGAKNKEAPSK